MPTPASVQRTYLLLLLGNTLAASLVWGINTIFLLDAGLSNLEAFAANAFFTAGMVIFEVPTGIVADTVGRRASYLLGTLTLAGSTVLYVLLWQVEAPFWEWAAVSLLLGLGFTFFSGAVEAWLVDALAATGFTGELESVFGRGQVVTGVAMLTGSVLGGFIAEQVSLGAPFVLRGVILIVMFVVAFRVMHDIGFSPEKGGGPLAEMRKIASASIENGWRVPAVKWLMVEALFTGGVGIYAFYALQPYLLELYGDPQAYQIAGLVAAIVAGAQILGGVAAPWIRRRFPPPDLGADRDGSTQRGHARPDRDDRELLAGNWADRGLGPALCGHDAHTPGLPQRPDPLEAAGHDHLLRLADGLQRRGLGPARAGPSRRRVGLRAVISRQRRHLEPGAPVPGPLEAAERPGGHAGRRRRRARPATCVVQTSAVAFLHRLLPPRPTFAQDMSPAEAEVMERPVGYWQDLLERELAVAFGPVLHPEEPWGLRHPGGRRRAGRPARSATAIRPSRAAPCSYEVVPMQLVRAG